MNYSHILRRSFTLIRRVPALLVLGFLVALVSGGSSIPNFNYSLGSDFGDLPPNVTPPPLPSIRPEAILPFVLVGIFVILVLALIAVIVRYVAAAGLIDAAARANDDQTVGVMESLKRGASRRALNLFLADLVVYLPIVVIVIVLMAIAAAPLIFGIFGAAQDRPGIFLGGLGGFFLLLLPFLAVFTVVSIVATILLQWAHRAVVLGNRGPIAGVAAGWRVLRTNVVESLVLWVIHLVLTFVGAIAGIVVGLLFLALGGGALFLVWTLAESWIVLLVLAIPVVLVLWIAASIVQGIVVAYIETYWTLAWLELTGTATTEVV